MSLKIAATVESKNQSISIDNEETGVEVQVPDPIVQRRLLWKLDLIVMPLLSIIYFTHSLDRGALGNARTDKLEYDLGLVGNQFSLVLVLFYVPYGICTIPATVLAKRFSPAVTIPILTFFWGTMAAATAGVTNFGGLLAVRICFGVVEAGFYPSAVFYLTLFYTRHEIAKRIAIFFMMGFVANGVSGLIAFSVFQWQNSLHGWQYLFLIEGALTIFIAITTFLLLPRSIATSKYFTEAERECSNLRLEVESDAESKLSMTAILKPLLDWHTWIYGFMALCYGVGLASCANFLPTIIKRITLEAVQANLYVLAPSLSGGLFIILVCWVSDKTQQRALFTGLSMLVPMVGYFCMATLNLVHRSAFGYFFTFMLTFGSFTPAVLVPAWVSGNSSSASGRATTLGLIAGLQNIGGIISSQSFRVQDGPIFKPFLIVSGSFQAMVCITAALLYTYYRRLNRQLDFGERPFVKGMETKPEFRFVL